MNIVFKIGIHAISSPKIKQIKFDLKSINNYTGIYLSLLSHVHTYFHL